LSVPLNPSIYHKLFDKIMTVATQSQQVTLLQPQIITHKSDDDDAVAAVAVVKNSLKLSYCQKENRRISFKETVSVRPIAHMNDMTKSHIRAVWYEQSEFDEIKKRFLQTIRLMSFHENQIIVDNNDDDNHCIRGLEYRTSEGAAIRQENKWNALNAVLDEQDRQRQLGTRNDKLLCQVYMRENRLSRLNALKLGILDEKAAKSVLSEQCMEWKCEED
jgi:hypothetical protein